MPDEIAPMYAERRLAGAEEWSVVMRKRRPEQGAVCDPVPRDGNTYEYRARSFDAAGNYSPYTPIVTVLRRLPA